MRISTLAHGLALLVSLLTLSAPKVHAEPSDRDVERLYDQAKTQLQSRHFDQALESCWRGLETPGLAEERRWGFLSGAAMAYEGLQQPIHSLEMYHRLLREISAQGDAAPKVWRKREAHIGEFVRKFEADVLAAHGALAVDSTPTGARLAFDGKPYGPDGASRTPTTMYLSPGTHLVRFELAGHAPVEVSVVIRAGLRDRAIANLSLLAAPAPEPAQVAVALVPVEPPQSPNVGGDPATPTLVEPARSPRLAPLWGWVLLGSGGALVLAGVPFTVLAFNDRDALTKASEGTSVADLERYGSLKSGVQTKQTIAGVLYGVGGAALAGGTAWLIVAHVLGTEPGDAPTVGLVPTSGGFSMTFGGSL